MGWASEVQALLDRAAADKVVPGAVAAATWLGQMIEAVSGQDLAAYLAEHVFGPLGMSDTTFAPTDEQRRCLMAIHSRTADGGLVVNDLEVPIADPEFWPAGHGSYGTASDYARFMAALLGDGELDGNLIPRCSSRRCRSCPTTFRHYRSRRAGDSVFTCSPRTFPG